MPRDARNPTGLLALAIAAFALPALGACSRDAADAPPRPPPHARLALLDREIPDSAPASDAEVASLDAGVDVVTEAQAPAVDGPHWLTLEPGRTLYYVLPGVPPAGGARLIVNLHGTCGGPEYACNPWMHAAVSVGGALVAPTGNAHCGPSPLSPPTWEAPSWGELVRTMDADLERSVARVVRRHPGAIRREGAILTGYSRGGYAVPVIATTHPGRWPLLLVIEADATLEPAALRRARVRAAALVAGEWGEQIAGMKKSVEALQAAGFPAKLFVMPKTGHLYSADMDDVMREALAFLVAQDVDVPSDR